jgi:hypothetical protein
MRRAKRDGHIRSVKETVRRITVTVDANRPEKETDSPPRRQSRPTATHQKRTGYPMQGRKKNSNGGIKTLSATTRAAGSRLKLDERDGVPKRTACPEI